MQRLTEQMHEPEQVWEKEKERQTKGQETVE